jgi:hypothetical protein
MKKTMMLAAAAALATLSVTDDASAGGALGPIGGRGLLNLVGATIESPGLGCLGYIESVVPLGRRAAFDLTCTYLFEWVSPWNPNDVGLCYLSEVRNIQNTSCIVNAYDGLGLPRAVASGDFAGGLDCIGFDFLGVPQYVSILGAAIDGTVTGMAILDGFASVSLVIA